MSRINKVICDKCKKELKDTDYFKLTVSSSFRDKNGYIKNAPAERIDLCPACFKELKQFLERS